MEKLKKVIAVIVTYNRKELLKECVEAVLNQDYKNCDILIVDNASTDGTREYVKELLKNNRVHYMNTGANLGGAGGFNFGIKEAYKLGCDFIWIMDDDCIVHKDSLVNLLNANDILNGEYGFLSSKVLWKDNSICKMNVPKKRFSKWLKDYDTNMQKIEMASFVSLFIKAQVVKEVGLPIKDFFIWTDDWEYTRRISRKYACYYISDSIVTHKSTLNEGASISTVDGERLNRFKYMYRNDVVLYRREGIKGWILLYLRLILHKLRILKSNKKDKKNRIKIINESIREGKNFFPKIEYVYDKQLKVLQVYGEPISFGGQEAFSMNIYRKIDRSKVQFDFFTPFYCDNKEMSAEIEKLGGSLFYRNSKFQILFRKHNFKKYLKQFLKNKKYEVIHINSGSTYELAYGAKIAKENNVKKVIVHTHSISTTNSLKSKVKNKIIKMITRKIFLKNVDVFLACSESAAETKFPKEIVKSKKYEVIKNGIDIQLFQFKPDIREKYRKDMNLRDKFVICHVGRFSNEKNQVFLLEVLKEIKNEKKDIILLLIGEGENKNKIIEQIRKNKLEKNVRLLGKRQDVNNILMASDIFVFPSLYEGLGIAAIEAQTTGLPTICSNNIQKEAKVTDLFYSLNLDDDIKNWKNLILSFQNKKIEREDKAEMVKKLGYDSCNSANRLLEIYYQ